MKTLNLKFLTRVKAEEVSRFFMNVIAEGRSDTKVIVSLLFFVLKPFSGTWKQKSYSVSHL